MRVWMRKSDGQLGLALNDWWDGWMCTIDKLLLEARAEIARLGEGGDAT